MRDVCTLKILLKGATRGPAAKNAPDSEEAIAVNAALLSLVEKYSALEVGRCNALDPGLKAPPGFKKFNPNEEKITFNLNLVISELAPLHRG